MSYVTHGFIDKSGEVSTTRFYLPQITSANHDAVTGNGAAQNVGELRLAVAALTLCNFTGHNVAWGTHTEVGSEPTDDNAQREMKLLVKYIDDVTGAKYRVTIPGVDLSLVAQQGTDAVDITAGQAAALVTAMETYAVSPVGNAITVQSMRIVGRNN